MAYAQRQNGTRPTRRKVYSPGGLAYWKRKQKLEASPDEVRAWILTCGACGHIGTVDCSLRRLRAANLVCSECGAVLGKR